MVLEFEPKNDSVKVSKATMKKLNWMAKHYFVVEGEKPMPIDKLIKQMVDEEYRIANPPKDPTYKY